MVRIRKGRKIHGVVLLDKPTGISSNDLVQEVKRLYGAQKAGHTGALDPLATGMLPICLGEATKFSQFLLDADKAYQVRARLGLRTDTSDSDGNIIQMRSVNVSFDQLNEALKTFIGTSMQVPSMFSALKYHGKPLYEYARQGIEVPRSARAITVTKINLQSFADDEVTLEIYCSKGTYIRTIIDDLGEVLGCGAHVVMLRRIAVANYQAEDMLTLEQLQGLSLECERQDKWQALDQVLLPIDTSLAQLPLVHLNAEQTAKIMQGQSILAENLITSQEQDVQIRLLDQDKTFIGVAILTADHKLQPKRLLVL